MAKYRVVQKYKDCFTVETTHWFLPWWYTFSYGINEGGGSWIIERSTAELAEQDLRNVLATYPMRNRIIIKELEL